MKGRLRSSFLVLLAIVSVAAAPALSEEKTAQPDDWQRRLEMLRSVPYLALTRTEAEEGDTGVVWYDPERAWNGYQLACRLSAGEVYLMDMAGRKIHRWRYLPGSHRGEDHAILVDNADVEIIKKFSHVARYDWHSRLLWERELEAHHDLARAADGSFYVIAQEAHRYHDAEVSFDVLIHLSPDGELIDRWSTYRHRREIVRALDREPFLDRIARQFHGRLPDRRRQEREGRVSEFEDAADAAAGEDRYEYFHMNTVGVLPENELGARDERFRPGHLLVCFRNVNLIAILDQDSYRLLWSWGQGELQWPHHPTLLPNGHILVFDNGIHRKYSRVIELDPGRETIVWEYTARPLEDFYSPTRGSAQRLDNGNTLICESDNGRVFEVNMDGEVVWEWLNPVIIGNRRETVYRMIRLAPDTVEPLLDRWWWGIGG